METVVVEAGVGEEEEEEGEIRVICRVSTTEQADVKTHRVPAVDEDRG